MGKDTAFYIVVGGSVALTALLVALMLALAIGDTTVGSYQRL